MGEAGGRWGRPPRTRCGSCSAAPRTSCPPALCAAGAILVLRPLLPSVRPFRAGAICLLLGVTLGLAAGSLGLGPGRAAHEPLLDPGYVSDRGGALGELLFASSRALFSELGAHILFLFLMTGGVLLVTGASIAGVVKAAGEHVSTTTQRVRTAGARTDRCARTRHGGRPLGPAGAARRRAGGARHPRRGARARCRVALPRPLRRRARGHGRPRSRARRAGARGARGHRRPSAGAGRPCRGRGTAHRHGPGAADADGQPAHRRDRGRGPRLHAAARRLPQALEREGQAQVGRGRARGGAAGGGARPLRRRGPGGGQRERPARDPLRAAPGARDQDVEGREHARRPGLRARGRRRAHPRPDPRQARRGRRGAEPAAPDGAPGRRGPGGARRGGRRSPSGSARTSTARRSASTWPASRTCSWPAPPARASPAA